MNPRRRWLRRLLTAGVATPAVIAVVGFWIVPPLVKQVVETQLAEAVGRRVTVSRVRANPFSLSLTIDNFQVFEADGQTPFAGFRRLHVNAQLVSVYRRAPVIREIRLDAPQLRVVRLRLPEPAGDKPTAFNFSDIAARLSAEPTAKRPPAAPDAHPPRFSFNNIRITEGEVVFEDRPLGKVHKISGFELGIPFVSTLPTFVDTFVEPGLRMTIDGTPFVIAGRTKPFKDSLETTIELRADNFDLTRYLPYVPVGLRFDVVSALLDVNVDVSFLRPTTNAPRLTAKGRVALEKVVLREKNGGAPLVGLKELEVVVGEADLMASQFKIERVKIAGLQVHARRLPNGKLNLETLVPETPDSAKNTKQDAAAKSSAPPKTGEGVGFEVGEVVIADAAAWVRDETVRPPFEMVVQPIVASVRGLSNVRARPATVKIEMRANPGGTLTHQGTFTLAPLAGVGTTTLEGLEPARFAAYYRDAIAFDVRRGRVGVGAKVEFSESQGARALAVQVTEAFVELADLALRRRGGDEDFLAVDNFAIRGVNVDPARRIAAVGEIVTRDAKFQVERNAAGVIDLSTLGSPPAMASGTDTDANANANANADADADADAAGSWAVTLARFDMARWSGRFVDRAVKPKTTLTLSPIDIKASGFGTVPGTRGTLDLKVGINKRGHLAMAGTAAVEPFSADVKLQLRTLEIVPLQAYFSDSINLVVTDGTVSIAGQAKLESPKVPARVKAVSGAPGSISSPAAAEPRISFVGDIDVPNFASVDGAKHDEFLKWKSLHVGRLALSTVPMSVSIREIALTDFYSRLMIFPDAHFNVQDILAVPETKKAGAAPSAKRPTAAAPSSPATAPSPTATVPVRIDQVTLQGGHVSFTDRFIRPNYAAELTDLAGRISGLSADGATQADVDIRGSVDGSGNLSIVGKANPLAPDLFVDVKVNLKEFELPPTSPYAAKYAGYGISKGKLALALDYHIANRTLDAKNRLVVEQFTFGDKVESADATRLPVRLAVALLKDRHGVIDIDLPIAGSLDSPDFKVGRAILKVLGNLLVKAATSPFAMIASAFGGGDELSYVEFAPGGAALDAKARTKMAALAKALTERPGLSFEIEGGADRDRDRDELKRNLYERKLKTQKMLELVQAGAAVADVDLVKLEAAELPGLVSKTYQAETFPKPRNVLGRPKDLPAPEMQKLILTNTVVDDEALRALAERRAIIVREALAKAAPDGATRLFLTTPRVASRSQVAGNRVEFKLKKN